MDWTTLLSSVAISGGLFGGLSFALKKSVDQSLSVFFDTVKEQRKGRIQEELRRQAVIYDRQFESLRTASALVYRIRNSVRDLAEAIDKHGHEQLEASVEQISRRIQAYEKALDELLFEDRVYFSREVFKFVHDTRHIMREISLLVTQVQKRSGRNFQQEKEQMRNIVERINTVYEALVPVVQEELGIAKEA